MWAKLLVQTTSMHDARTRRGSTATTEHPHTCYTPAEEMAEFGASAAVKHLGENELIEEQIAYTNDLFP